MERQRFAAQVGQEGRDRLGHGLRRSAQRPAKHLRLRLYCAITQYNGAALRGRFGSVDVEAQARRVDRERGNAERRSAAGRTLQRGDLEWRSAALTVCE